MIVDVDILLVVFLVVVEGLSKVMVMVIFCGCSNGWILFKVLAVVSITVVVFVVVFVVVVFVFV